MTAHVSGARLLLAVCSICHSQQCRKTCDEKRVHGCAVCVVSSCELRERAVVASYRRLERSHAHVHMRNNCLFWYFLVIIERNTIGCFTRSPSASHSPSSLSSLTAIKSTTMASILLRRQLSRAPTRPSQIFRRASAVASSSKQRCLSTSAVLRQAEPLDEAAEAADRYERNLKRDIHTVEDLQSMTAFDVLSEEGEKKGRQMRHFTGVFASSICLN